MNETPTGQIPTVRARLKVVKTGQTWHAKLPGACELTCVLIDEVTPKTVALSQVADLTYDLVLGARRYRRVDVEFVEKVPA